MALARFDVLCQSPTNLAITCKPCYVYVYHCLCVCDCVYIRDRVTVWVYVYVSITRNLCNL